MIKVSTYLTCPKDLTMLYRMDRPKMRGKECVMRSVIEMRWHVKIQNHHENSPSTT